ncbi:WD repeat, SAM and U-box domain-containing protein 1-like [Gouania willdenowi]|uniref:WD repeat, SAM and U-box domain-containing protein 1-like n=1 Tax=Gouania willdenowi TaxID=441366 RepID=UPI0010541FC6|nr:WD repeat, SAM and U-box domain-containing protein 1-like [Gouania willdenowi]
MVLLLHLRVYSTADFTELPSPRSGATVTGSQLLFQLVRRLPAQLLHGRSAISWRTDTGEVSAVLQHPSRSPLRACSLAPDTSLLLAGATDGTATLWDFSSQTLRRCSVVSEASVVACCFSPCGQMFVTGCTNGDLKLWDIDVHLLHAEKDAHDLGVACCCFCSQFKVDDCCVEFRLASCGQDNQMKVWIVSQREGGGRPAS